MTTPIRLPNGEIIEIATSDPKQAAAAAQRVWAKRSAPKLPKAPPKGRGVLGTAADALGSAIDTFTGGYGDELAGAGNVVANAAKAAVGREEFAHSQAFDEGQAQFDRSEEHTSELQSQMRNSYAVLCWKKKKTQEEYT